MGKARTSMRKNASSHCEGHKSKKYRSKLWESIPDETINCLMAYLNCHDIGNEDPILVVEWLPRLDTVKYCPTSL